ncbi:MAG: hypothetical protein GY866_36445 [Proteobacteria bacterium]|nr:hypothetical protein [Pseudomonadota bacterium]
MLIKTKRPTKAEEIIAFYNRFVEKFQFDAYGFVLSALNANPSLDQIRILKDVSEPGGNYAYSSGHHTGKSFVGGAITHWLEICSPQSQTYLAADTEAKIKATIWKEVHIMKGILEKRIPHIMKMFTITDENYYHNLRKLSWFVHMKATGDINKADTNFSGLHAKWLTLMIDEASGVLDPVYNAIDGTTTKETNRTILLSQRTKNSGRMHDAFGKLSDVYVSRILDTEKSPLVTIPEIRTYRKKFNGRHTDQYRIRVKGLEGRQQSGMLLSRTVCENLFGIPIKHIQQKGYILICDPSGEGHRDRTGLLIAEVSGNEDERKLKTIELRDIPNLNDSKKHTMDVANEIANIYNSGKYPLLTIGVDYIGVGNGVCHKLTELKIPHIRFQWGQPSWYKLRFRDQKMEGYEWFKDAVGRGDVGFLDNFLREPFLEEVDKLPFAYNDKGLKFMIGKEKLKKEGISSPDLSDCYAMGFLIEYKPIGETRTVLQREIEDSVDLSWMDQI